MSIDQSSRTPDSTGEASRGGDAHPTSSEPLDGPVGARRASLAIALLAALVGLLFVAALLLELDYVNGRPRYWRWPWLPLDLSDVFWTLLPGLVLQAAGLALLLRPGAPPRSTRVAIGLFFAAALLLQLGSASIHGRDAEWLERTIRSRQATSYFTDAQAIDEVGPWLARFHGLRLAVHSATHPPGPILFHRAWIALCGEQRAPVVGGIVIFFGAAATVFLVPPFAALFGAGRREQALAAALWTLLPALLRFQPQLDQIYPALTMLLAVLWWRALSGDLRSTIGFGMTLALALFMAYNLVVLGALFVLLALGAIACGGDRAATALRAWRATKIVALLVSGLYLLLFLAAGFRPFASFLRALETHKAIGPDAKRLWSLAVLWDPLDFALGAGWLPVVLWVAWLVRCSRSAAPSSVARWTSWAAALTLLIVDLSGLLRGETARVWLFLQPLWIVPAALELSRQPRRAQIALFAVQALVLVAVRTKLGYLD